MRKLNAAHAIPPKGTLEAAHLQRLMDMDVAFQIKLKVLEKRLPCILYSRLKTGSGLQVSALLRSYFFEYFDRIFKHGPDSFPTSFNVVESFLHFDPENFYFDLRRESEHLLSINDYFRWYAKGEIPQDPLILQDMMAEGVIYSYDMIGDDSGLRISGDSQQVFAGVSFVRHGHELSCLLLAGENPPHVADDDARQVVPADAVDSRKELVPNPSLTAKDRYLDLYPNFAKVIVLTRFDLRAGKHDVRYVHLDVGPSFIVFTDDSSVFRDIPPEKAEILRQHATNGLGRYDNLFAALTSMIYLPAFFAAFPQNVKELKVVTELHAMRDKMARKTIATVGESQCPKHRTIRCFPTSSGVNDGPLKPIDPPQMEFKCDGYWKAIGPQNIGEDKNGDRILGRTWVSRHESWSAKSPKSFLLQQSNAEPKGSDPGIIYVQRSPALDRELYKVGVTRRTASSRAGELSSATGVPLPYDVLATWKVGDCTGVEQEVHKRLAACRVNPRREFFRAELRHIIETINAVIS